MAEFLKGNFKIKHEVEKPETNKTGLQEEFERTAMKRLGGSIAFVSRKGFVWTGDDGGSE